MGRSRPRTPAMACPHCSSKATVRSSKEVTPTYRTLHYRCDNDECGHAFVAQLAIIHSTRSSAIPNPAVDLPLRLAAAVKTIAPGGLLTDAASFRGSLDRLSTVPSI